MNIGTAFPSKYIRAADLGRNRPVVAIDSVTMEEIGDDEPKPVIHFQGKTKGLVLNKTNANMIQEITGTPETEHWRGKRIVLYASKTDFGGKRVDCIRVDYPPVGAPMSASAPAPAYQPPPQPIRTPVSEFQQGGEFSEGEQGQPYMADDSDVPF